VEVRDENTAVVIRRHVVWLIRTKN
jgi:hypothetical protein